MKALKRRGGFSMVEVVVVCAMTLILSGIFIGYNRTSGKQLILYSEQSRVIGTLNEAKALALQKFKENNSQPDTIICAYGVRFDAVNGQYFVFRVQKDMDDSVCPVSDESRREVVSKYELDRNVEIVSATSDWVAFEAPYLKVSPVSGARVTLRLTTGGFSKTVEVGTGGAVTPIAPAAGMPENYK
ncbi:MAG: hypothetical protein UX22_C0026G0007 [Candidatus Jorgensenbacteria bacterium GW2011_GWA2_45_9]|uniref:Uncharacterized protein n=2 Tax=Candidatus Joergenseniibacteriota TaxID=1752739 RepID=A0A0G1R0D7_9BACT|nr:MAG: hypothetical protein UX22_C0026G0007 [Candidatus Jorgensenbacteria bacterium GW2011_GWA2_45_9]